MRRPLRVVAVLAIIAFTVGAAGCYGLGSDEEVPERTTGPALVTKAQLAALEPGSPARVMFEWWRALQFDNAIAASRYYARDVGMTVDKLDRDLSLGAAGLGLTTRPRLVEVDEHGDKATVLVLLEQLTPRPNGRVDKVQTARAFNMVRENGEWKLAENRYVARQARIQRFFSAEARRRATQPDQQPTTGTDSEGGATSP